MEKTMNGSASGEFTNTPHVSGSMDQDISSNSTGGSLRSKITNQAGPAMDYLKGNFRSVQDASQVYLGDAENIIRRYPFYSILGAVAVGAAVGMMFSRPSGIRAER